MGSGSLLVSRGQETKVRDQSNHFQIEDSSINCDYVADRRIKVRSPPSTKLRVGFLTGPEVCNKYS